MQEILKQLLSKKFLLAVAGLITLAAYREWAQFVIVLLGYLGVQGASDITDSVTSYKLKQSGKE